jgi:hypothetical protein
VAEARLLLAQALWESAQDRPRALALATAARDACQTLGEPGAECSRKASAWLAGHAS